MAIDYNLNLLDSLKEEMRGEKLYQEPPKTVLQPEVEEITDEDCDKVFSPYSEEQEEENEQTGVSLVDFEELPEFIVGLIDVFASSLAEIWTKTENREQYELTEAEKAQLVLAWKMYLQTTRKFDVSPSTLLIITTLSIYSPKFMLAMSERKERKLQEQQ